MMMRPLQTDWLRRLPPRGPIEPYIKRPSQLSQYMRSTSRQKPWKHSIVCSSSFPTPFDEHDGMDSWFQFGPLSDGTNNRAHERAGERAGSREAMELAFQICSGQGEEQMHLFLDELSTAILQDKQLVNFSNEVERGVKITSLTHILMIVAEILKKNRLGPHLVSKVLVILSVLSQMECSQKGVDSRWKELTALYCDLFRSSIVWEPDALDGLVVCRALWAAANASPEIRLENWRFGPTFVRIFREMLGTGRPSMSSDEAVSAFAALAKMRRINDTQGTSHDIHRDVVRSLMECIDAKPWHCFSDDQHRMISGSKNILLNNL